jgi:hypothetical protein
MSNPLVELLKTHKPNQDCSLCEGNNEIKLECSKGNCSLQTDLMKKAAAQIESLESRLEVLKDPMAVHVGMVLGSLGRPNIQQISHLYDPALLGPACAAQTDEYAWVPKEPPIGLLVSMAVCQDHDFGMPEKTEDILNADYRIRFGKTVAEYQKDVLLKMKRLYNEVVGRGAWAPERDEFYTRSLVKSILPTPAIGTSGTANDND